MAPREAKEREAALMTTTPRVVKERAAVIPAAPREAKEREVALMTTTPRVAKAARARAAVPGAQRYVLWFCHFHFSIIGHLLFH